MEGKLEYYTALKQNNGSMDETNLGEYLGFNDDETQQILSQLLAEHKIEYVPHHASNYRVLKT